jgi:ornithine cyclodeaminase/alanine dehydrogenase-like protein (mu-crystallin family)
LSTDHILVVNPQEVEQLLPLERGIEAVEAAYRAHASGEAILFPVVRERLVGGAVCGVKSGHWAARHVVGLKLAGYWPGNSAVQRPNHQASFLLADADTGRLLAVMDGNVITQRRTAGAGVVAARLLARPRPRILAVLGCGAQGRNQAHALAGSFPSLSEVHLWDRDPARAEAVAGALRATHNVQVSTAADPAAAIRNADVIATTTASTSALFDLDDVRAGAHVNAMGSDTAGKRELAPRLVESCLLVVDDRSQSVLLGESQPPVHLKDEPPTIGEILVGRRQGRSSDDQITVFDSTGIGLQDIAAADLVYRDAMRLNRGRSVRWDLPDSADLRDEDRSALA